MAPTTTYKTYNLLQPTTQPHYHTTITTHTSPLPPHYPTLAIGPRARIIRMSQDIPKLRPISHHQGRSWRHWYIRIAVTLLFCVRFILTNQNSLTDLAGKGDSTAIKPALRYSKAANGANDRQEKEQQEHPSQNEPADVSEQSSVLVHVAEKSAASISAVQQSGAVLQPEAKSTISSAEEEPEILQQAESQSQKSESADNTAVQNSLSTATDEKPADNKITQPTTTTTTSSDKFEFISKLAYNFTAGEKIFYDTAHSFKPVTDKVTGGGGEHNYEVMYGQFLLPFYAAKPNMKFLEIGLGCDMSYGPGASVAVWKKLFPDADLWEAEYNATCVEKAKGDGMLDGFKTLTGDQMDVDVLDGWIKESGGADFVSVRV